MHSTAWLTTRWDYAILNQATCICYCSFLILGLLLYYWSNKFRNVWAKINLDPPLGFIALFLELQSDSLGFFVWIYPNHYYDLCLLTLKLYCCDLSLFNFEIILLCLCLLTLKLSFQMLNKEHEREEDSKTVTVPSVASSWGLRGLWCFGALRASLFNTINTMDKDNDTFLVTCVGFLEHSCMDQRNTCNMN